MSSNALLPMWHKDADWSLTSYWGSSACQSKHGSRDLNQNLLVRQLWFSKLHNMLWADFQSGVCVLLPSQQDGPIASSGTPWCVFEMKVGTCGHTQTALGCWPLLLKLWWVEAVPLCMSLCSSTCLYRFGANEVEGKLILGRRDWLAGTSGTLSTCCDAWKVDGQSILTVSGAACTGCIGTDIDSGRCFLACPPLGCVNRFLQPMFKSSKIQLLWTKWNNV